MKTTNRQYAKQIRRMMERARQWRLTHPQAVIEVQFNFPPHVELICPISVAIEKQFVVVNAPALELIKHIGKMGHTREVTVMMVRAALEREMPRLYKDAVKQGINSVEYTRGQFKIR